MKTKPTVQAIAYLDRAAPASEGGSVIVVSRKARAGRSGEFIPEGSYRFFGAPAAVLVYVHEDLLPLLLVCCGAFMTQLTLAAHAEGLGTCVIGFVRTADRQMREVLSVPVDEVCRFFD